jgi:putative acetyltransferase
MPAPVQVRPIEDRDVAPVADLWVEAWREVVPDIDFEARRPWFLQRIEGLRGDGARVDVAVDSETGDVLGLVTVDLRTGHLDQLVVARSAWGSGAAQRLLAHARTISPAGLDLEVNAVNSRAIRFYEREGFRRTGEGLSPASGLPLFTYSWRPEP